MKVFHPAQLHTLTSFYYFKDFDFDTEMNEKWFKGLERPVIFADSGAFSAKMKGEVISLDDYAQWVKRWSEWFKVYANLDVIGDPDATLRNQTILEDKYGLEPLPVFHLGSDMRYLEDYIKKGYTYIALGGMAIWSKFPKVLYPFLINAFRLTEEAGVMVHGFGVTNYKYLRSFRWFSVDSITWLAGGKFNSVPLWDDKRKRLINFEPNREWSLKEHAVSIRTMGFDPADFYLGGRKRHYFKVLLLGAASYWKAEHFLRDTMGVRTHPTYGDGLRIYLGDSIYWNNKSYKIVNVWRMALSYDEL